MVLLLTKHLEMDANYTGRCDSEWGSKAITPLENELEEGEIGEEDDEIYVLAEFERKDANNGNCEIRPTKGDIDERLPFITFTDNARKVSMTIAKPRNFPKVEGRGKRVYDRGEDRRPREKNRDRGRRSTSPPGSSFNTRNNNSNRPHMSCYSLRRQSILRSIHRRSRTSGHDLASSRSRISRSYDDLLAEYQDIKSKLRHLIHEEKNLKSDDENSNEGSYGDKENRVYRRNGSSRISRVENRTQNNRQCRLSSRSSESHSPVVEGASKEDEEEEEDVLRKIALASKSKCKQTSTLAASPVNEPQAVSSVDVDAGVKVEESSAEIAKETSLDVEEDEDLLRAQLLSSLTLKQLDKLDVIDLPENVPEIVRSSESVLGGKLSAEASNAAALFKLPVHKPLVINLKEDSDSETETNFPVQQKIASLDSIDDFIRAARNLSDVGVKNAETSSAVESPPLSVYNLPESELKEYRRLKAEIANREQNKQSGIIKKKRIVLQKSVACKEESLMLAEEKCMKSRESLLSQEAELSKLVEQLNIDEKTLKATGLKICNLEQQLTAAKRLELLQKRRVAELKVKKLNLEQKVSVSKADNFKLQQVCLNIGKRVLGTEYKLPESGVTLKRLSLSQKVLPEDKKFKSPIRKPRTRQASIGTNQGTNKSSEWAAEKSRLQKKQQELLSKLAELRKQALKASANKPNVTTRQVSQTVVQSLKRTRRQSLTKKSKKLRLSESETASADVESKPSCSLDAVTVEIEKKYVVDNTLSVEDISFEFHHFFTNEVPKLELRDTIKVSSTTNDIVPDSFLPYRSPLLVFRAYRFSPYFRIKSNQNLSWSTYCHGLKPKVTVCRYDLTGKCNDDKCRWQHAVNYVVSAEECLRDLVQYAPRMVEETADAKEGGISNKLDGFVSNLLHCNQERMTLDQMCVLLVGRVNDYLNKVPPHFITFEERVDRFLIANATSSGMNRLTFDIKNKEDEREGLKWRINMELEPDGVCDESDVRYFEYDTQNNSTMQPVDEKGWMALAKKKLNSVGCSPPLCLDITLDILSRALESHTHSSCLWSFYLSLYARRQDCTDLMNLYRQAVTLAPNYDIWWQYLQSAKSYADKEALCEEILRYILQAEVDEDVKSHQILEILLYWAKLNVLTSKFDRAIQILEETLHRNPNKTCGVVHLVVDDMTSKDRCLIWLCYISLRVFHSLPNRLFSPENSGLGKVICKLPFILPWKSGGKWHLSIGDILDLFMDALRKCVLKGQPAKSNAQLCLPLYKNLIALELSRQRNQSAVKVCQQLRNVTSCDEAWITQACVYYRTSNFADLRKVMQLALSGTDATPVLFCFAIMFELKEKNISAATALCKRFLTSSCNQDNLNVERVDAIDAVFRHLLNLPVEDLSLISSIQRLSSISTQMAYVWLIYCMYLITQEKYSDAKSAFETAILRLTEREDLEMIWLHYLDICLCQAVSLSKLISLISRCLNSVPCKVTLPGSNGDLAHVSYAFFNLVLDKYISPLEIDVQIVIYERFLIFAPNNSLLAIRLLSLYLIQGEFQMAWRLCYAQLERTPRNLELWKIALQLAFKNRSPNEIRDVYQHATEALPYSEFLWKEFHAFEVSRGEVESAKDLVTKCLEHGVCIES